MSDLAHDPIFLHSEDSVHDDHLPPSNIVCISILPWLQVFGKGAFEVVEYIADLLNDVKPKPGCTC
jgi:hypothetical protein